MNVIQFIQSQVSTTPKNIESTIKLLEEDCTIPFISRYRKDQTGNLDEVVIEQIAKRNKQYHEIVKRKEAILKSIEEQKALTPELAKKIQDSFDLQELEDYYLPYKKKKKTKADVARENGLEPLAKIIMAQNNEDIDFIASRYLNDKVVNEDEALQGARDIIAEWINENIYVRKVIRRLFMRNATIITKVVKTKKDEDNAQKFKQYFDWSENVTKAPAHRLLAMLRAENEGFIKIKVEIESEEAIPIIEDSVIKRYNNCTPHLKLATEDCYKRLLAPAISNETLQEAKAKADANSIQVFASNLSQLLLAPPLGEKRILAIDPGFRSGCKVVCLDEKGDLLYNETIYPNAPQHEDVIAMKKIRSMVNAYKIDAISIGNGTASRETEFFIKKIAFDKPVQVFVVSEAGASVYSASKIAREEFPNFDVTVRGSVSIGRRLSDPLAELVKIDPKAIGVGQYQHDVDQTKLKEELDSTVIRCVNSVGININTASKSLLSYVSGIGEKLAENIVQYRLENGPFEDRKQLKKVPRLGEKAYQQGVAFIRISNAKNPLDNSAVHPESYGVVERMASHLKADTKSLVGNAALSQKLAAKDFVDGQFGLPTIMDILQELAKPGRDPRSEFRVVHFSESVHSMQDLKPGMVLEGSITNVTHFGAFIDIGVHQDALIHISQLADVYVKDPSEIVAVGDILKVKVLDVDIERKRIAVTRKF